MKSEYIRFYGPEMVYGQKSLLKGKISTLSQIKSFEKYSQLRKEELALKVALKVKLEEVKQILVLLEKELPKASTKLSGYEELANTEKRKVLSIEQEIESIKSQIAKLH